MQELINFLTNLINNTYLFVFFISCLYTLRHLVLFSLNLKTGTAYKMNSQQLKHLGAAIAVILTIIFTGTKLI